MPEQFTDALKKVCATNLARRQIYLTGILFLTFWTGTCLSAPVFPELTGRVVDKADLLSIEKETTLTTKLADLEKSSSNQIVVVTLPDIQGYDIAQFTIELARHWKIGQKKHDNGAVLLIAVKEKQVRIEVGYGLEGFLTDATSSSIIRNEIRPAFRAGNYVLGIDQGVNAMISAVKGSYVTKEDSTETQNKIEGFLPLIFITLVGLSEFFKRQFSRKFGAGVAFGGMAGLIATLVSSSLLMGVFVGIAAFFFAFFTGGSGGTGTGLGSRGYSSYDNGSFRRGGGFGGGGGGFGGGFGGGGGGFGGGGASGGW